MGLLYEHEAHAMFCAALRILRRRELAEEAVQDAFMQVWQKAASFDAGKGAGRAWLHAVLRHRALNILRSGAREELSGGGPTEETDEGPDPEAALVISDETARLRRCLDRLEPAHRRGLLLAYGSDLTHSAVAQALGVPLGTAKSWIRRAALQVRAQMSLCLLGVALPLIG